VPSPDRIAVFVGLLGDYVGMVSVPAKTAYFPNEGDFTQKRGLVLLLACIAESGGGDASL